MQRNFCSPLLPESANIEIAQSLSEAEASHRKLEMIEILEVLVLAVVAITTAWSGYQASKWDARQSLNCAAGICSVPQRDRTTVEDRSSAVRRERHQLGLARVRRGLNRLATPPVTANRCPHAACRMSQIVAPQVQPAGNAMDYLGFGELGGPRHFRKFDMVGGR